MEEKTIFWWEKGKYAYSINLMTKECDVHFQSWEIEGQDELLSSGRNLFNAEKVIFDKRSDRLTNWLLACGLSWPKESSINDYLHRYASLYEKKEEKKRLTTQLTYAR